MLIARIDQAEFLRNDRLQKQSKSHGRCFWLQHRKEILQGLVLVVDVLSKTSRFANEDHSKVRSN